jgi:hypothetical protein
MTEAGTDAAGFVGVEWKTIETFESMRDQAIKEIEQ